MAAINKRSNGRWQARIRLKGHPTVTKQFRTKAAAERWAKDEETRIESGGRDLTSLRTKTVTDMLDDYEKSVSRDKRGYHTSEKHRLNKLRDRLGWEEDRRTAAVVSDLTAQRLLDYVKEELNRGRSHDTVRRELGLISSILNYAANVWGWPIQENTAQQALAQLKSGKRLRPMAHRERRLRPGEYRRLLKASDPEMRLVIRLIVETAMRRGDVVKVRPAHLCEEGLKIVDDKAYKTTIIPLSRRARRLIKQLPENGLGLHASTLSHRFLRACRAAGIEDLRLHDLRHEGTSRLFEKGLTVPEVAMITRHSDWQMLKRYTHPTAGQVSNKLS